MQIENPIEELNIEFEQMRKEYLKKGSKLLTNYFEKIFDNISEVKAIRWTQFTHGFNDGEPCYFHIGEIEFFPDDPEVIELEIDVLKEKGEKKYLEEYNLRYYGDKSLKEKIETIADTIESATDILKFMYGEPTTVTVTRQGISIETMEETPY